MNTTVTDLEFSFSNDAHRRSNDEFVAEVKTGVSSTLELLDSLAKELNVPNYFGRNWNSLVDILRDLSWIEQKRITIYHNELPSLHADDLNTYLDILQTRVREWKSRGGHLLSVVFPVTARGTIVRALDAQKRNKS
jgi:RNAse (barnase) inhibitor barstar